MIQQVVSWDLLLLRWYQLGVYCSRVVCLGGYISGTADFVAQISPLLEELPQGHLYSLLRCRINFNLKDMLMFIRLEYFSGGKLIAIFARPSDSVILSLICDIMCVAAPQCINLCTLCRKPSIQFLVIHYIYNNWYDFNIMLDVGIIICSQNMIDYIEPNTFQKNETFFYAVEYCRFAMMAEMCCYRRERH